MEKTRLAHFTKTTLSWWTIATETLLWPSYISHHTAKWHYQSRTVWNSERDRFRQIKLKISSSQHNLFCSYQSQSRCCYTCELHIALPVTDESHSHSQWIEWSTANLPFTVIGECRYTFFSWQHSPVCISQAICDCRICWLGSDFWNLRFNLKRQRRVYHVGSHLWDNERASWRHQILRRTSGVSVSYSEMSAGALNSLLVYSFFCVKDISFR